MILSRRQNDGRVIGQNRARFPPRGPKIQVHLRCRQPIGRNVIVFPILWVFAKIPTDPVIPIAVGARFMGICVRSGFKPSLAKQRGSDRMNTTSTRQRVNLAGNWLHSLARRACIFHVSNGVSSVDVETKFHQLPRQGHAAGSMAGSSFETSLDF